MSILLLDMGGTITSAVDEVGTLNGSTARHRLAHILPKTHSSVIIEQLYSGLSEAMTFEDMMGVVAAVGRAETDETIEGIVVAHGTDIMEETAFLADLSCRLMKPIIFTGAQIPHGMPHSDATSNLADALTAASNQVLAPLGVLIAFGGYLIPAWQAYKADTVALRAFEARDGNVGTSTPIFSPPSPVDRLPLRDPVAPAASVEIVMLGAGCTGRLILSCIVSKVRGIVIAALGTGNAPASVIAAVQQANQAGIIVVISTRCVSGSTAPVYASGANLVDVGAMMSGPLGPSQSRMLLSVLIAAGDGRTAIAQVFSSVSSFGVLL
jgi:L-asparaginase